MKISTTHFNEPSENSAKVLLNLSRIYCLMAIAQSRCEKKAFGNLKENLDLTLSQ